MRISTQSYFNTSLAGIERQRLSISNLTQQLASGQRVNVASDDPVAFTQAQRLQASTQAIDQFTTDNANLSTQLGFGSQTLSSTLKLIDNVRSLALQAGNGTTNAANRTSLIEQVKSAKSQLLSLANTQNGSGAYLFAGSRGDAAPFALQPNGQVLYRGDGASDQTHTAANQTVSSLLSGDIFTSVPRGNGYAYLQASNTNAGSGQAVLTGVTSQSSATAFRAGTAAYSIKFSAGTTGLNYTVTQNGNTISSGAFKENMSLTLGGNSVQLKGEPAAGDQFKLQPSRPQSIFDTLDQLTTALEQPQSTASQHALNSQQVDAVLSNLDQGQTRLLSMQSTVGVAIRAIKATDNTNATQKSNNKQALSSAVDANIPQVLTALNQHNLALTSAMGAFGKLSKLSLFNYI